MTRNNSNSESDRKGRETNVSRRSVLRSAAVGFASLVGLGTLSTPVSAEQGAIFDFFESAESSTFSGLTRAWAAAKGGWNRALGDSSERTAKQAARDTTTVFNDNASTIATYANNQLDESREKSSIDTIRVVFEQDVTVERWIVGDVDDSNAFASVRMVATKPDRDADHWVRLKRLAATEAPDELETFVEQYATENRAVDPALEGRLAGKYGPDVESSLLKT